jgi:hypothetical protein
MIKSPTGKTDKAQLYFLDHQEYWLPISQISESVPEGEKNPMIKLVKMPMWLAVKQRLDLNIE